MGLSADDLVDRRNMRRKLSFWRILTLVTLVLAIFAIVASLGGFWVNSARQDHIARIKIYGMILSDKPLLDLIDQIKDEDQVKAVIVDISSRGGTTIGGEEIFEKLLELGKKKPVVAKIGTLAASAGYMIAAASDHIVARRSSIVGSIGVIFQAPNFDGLLEKLGVEITEIKSAPLKAEPSPFHPVTPEAEAMMKALIDDSYRWFVDLVAERRNFSPQKARRLADGRVFTGAQALENGLVDAIGGEDAALDWLIQSRKIDAGLEIITRKPERPGGSILAGDIGVGAAVFAWLAGRFGLGADIETPLMHRLHKLSASGLISRYGEPEGQ